MLVMHVQVREGEASARGNQLLLRAQSLGWSGFAQATAAGRAGLLTPGSLKHGRATTAPRGRGLCPGS